MKTNFSWKHCSRRKLKVFLVIQDVPSYLYVYVSLTKTGVDLSCTMTLHYYLDNTFHFLNFQAAYVENLNGPHLFESLFSDDPEAQKLASLPGVDELLLVYPFIAE